VLRALKLGDLLVAVPALHALRRALPDHRLVLAVPGWLDPIVELIGGVDGMLPTPGLDAALPVAPGVLDVAVNLHGSGPESRRRVDALRARTTIAHRVPEIDGDHPRDPRMPLWRDDLHERVRWVRLLKAYGFPGDANEVAQESARRRHAGPVGAAVVHVGSFYGSRRWPAERFARIAALLADAGHQVVLTGNMSERPRAVTVAAAAGLSESSVLAGTQDLGALAATIETAAVVVSADTGAAHLASAYARPSVVIFGPAAPEQWGPPPGPHEVLTVAAARRGDPFAAAPDPALLAVTVEDVWAAVGRVLHSGPGRVA